MHKNSSCALIAALLVLAVASTPALSADALVIQLNIAPKALADSLRELAALSNTNIAFDPLLVKGMRAPAVSGNLTAEEALGRLLEGTRLRARFVDEKTVSLVPVSEKAATGPASPSSSSSFVPNSGEDAWRGNEASLRLGQADSFSVSAEGASKDADEDRLKLEEIVVTGTHLKSTQPLSQVITLDRETLLSQGSGHIADAIDQLPQNFRGGASPASNPLTGFGDGASNNHSYASGINLRGLGANSTLVLLNGRRLPPTAYGATTDISSIPVSAVERVEILPDGASAIYGSDAVAGVVNIITRRTH